MTRRPTITPADRETIKRALNRAIRYEYDLADAYRGCTHPDDVAAVAACLRDVARFKRLLRKLQ